MSTSAKRKSGKAHMHKFITKRQSRQRATKAHVKFQTCKMCGFTEMHNPDVRASNMFRSQLMNPSMQQPQLQPQTALQKKCDAGSEANISQKSDMSSVSIVQAEPRVSRHGKNVFVFLLRLPSSAVHQS